MELSPEALVHMQKQITGILDVLRNPEISDKTVVDMVIDLYVAGVKDGYAKADGVVKAIMKDVTKLVIAHKAQDAAGVKAALDEFIERRVVIMKAGDKPAFTH